MKVRYVGESFGVCGLTDGKVYDCKGVFGGMLSIVDDEEFDDEGYLYSITNPRPADGSSKGGKWEIIEDENDILKNAFEKL